MLLKGYTEYGGRVDFSLQDCPILISDTKIALSGIKKSRLIKVNTIVRGDKETGVFEGDEVYCDGILLGIVVYSKGFFLQDLNKSLKKLSQLQHIQVKEGNVKTVRDAFYSPHRTALTFGYKNDRIDFKSFVTKSGEFISIAETSRLVDPKDLLFFTGYSRSDGRGIHFGELYKGGTVVLHNYEPAVRINTNEFIELEELIY